MSEERDIQKGFNQGYILQKYSPKLAEKLYASFKDQDSHYKIGFVKGCLEIQKEKLKTRELNYSISKDQLPKVRDKDKNKTIEK